MTQEELKKMQYLAQYIPLKDELGMISLQLEFWQAQAEQLKAQIITGMPRGGRDHNDDVEKAFEKIDEIVKVKSQYIVNYGNTIASIEQAVTDIEDPSCRKVLSLRYLEGMDWNEIMKRMSYSDTNIYRIHHKALSLFVIKK